jgi:hypothetical protein
VVFRKITSPNQIAKQYIVRIKVEIKFLLGVNENDDMFYRDKACIVFTLPFFFAR